MARGWQEKLEHCQTNFAPQPWEADLCRLHWSCRPSVLRLVQPLGCPAGIRRRQVGEIGVFIDLFIALAAPLKGHLRMSLSLGTALALSKWPAVCVSPAHRNHSLPNIRASGATAEMLLGHRSLHFPLWFLHPTFVNETSSNGPFY